MVSTPLELPCVDIHPAGQGFVAQLTLTNNNLAQAAATVPSPPKSPHCVLIMDNSGSMGQWSQRCANAIFPQALQVIGLRPDDPITLITFASSAQAFTLTVRDLPSFKLPPQGATQMRDVFGLIQLALAQLPLGAPVLVLALSDGAVHDSTETAAAAAKCAGALKGAGRHLESNPVGTAKKMGERLGGLFDGSGGGSLLSASEKVLQQNPWDGDAALSDSLHVTSGRNTFWLTAPPAAWSLNGVALRTRERPPLTADGVASLMADRVEHCLDQLKLLKVVDSLEARERVGAIVGWFRSFEASLALVADADEAPLLSGGGLAGRRQFLQRQTRKRARSVTNMLESVANDDKVRALNAAQQAEYLRTLDVSKNARGLARRAVASGLDFDATLRAEVRAMRAQLHTLDDVDDASHEVSFYSQATTLDGVRELCAMADDAETFDALSALELLAVFNVVGVPAATPLGDYPDPMTYRLERLLPGACVSVADLLIVEKMGGGAMGGKLTAPGHPDVPLTNAIPLFDDLRVQSFVQRHAPSTLEYLASVGMRRVICEVPKTFPYTICAAAWKLVGELAVAPPESRPELHVRTLRTLLPSYELALQDTHGVGQFDYLLPHLTHPKHGDDRSFFLNFNGATNLIAPLFRLVREGATDHLPAILRALYAFEVYQAMRKRCKGQPEDHASRLLDQLLGVDVASDRAPPLPPPFSRGADAPEVGDVVVDTALLTELSASFEYVHAVAALAPLCDAVQRPSDGEALAAARAVPCVAADGVVAAALRLDYPLDEFLLYNVVEGFLYNSKQKRLDKETNTPLRPDYGSAPGRAAGAAMCADYVSGRYRADWLRRLGERAGQERRQLLDELLASLRAAGSEAAFCALLREGITRGETTVKIANASSLGAAELLTTLLDEGTAVASRAGKLVLLLSARDSAGEVLWNGGNLYRTPLPPVRALLERIGKRAHWEKLEALYKAGRAHVYRGGADDANRHGHSNDKPSYFALGFSCVHAFRKEATEELWSEYAREHANCCGLHGGCLGCLPCTVAAAG